jgi:hypothetical protein
MLEIKSDEHADARQISMERREVLLGSAAATLAGLLYSSAQAADAPPDLVLSLERFRASIPSNFDRDYVEHVVVPFF